jgi:hypothetical protein
MTAQSAIPPFLLSWKKEPIVDYILMDICAVNDSRRIDSSRIDSRRIEAALFRRGPPKVSVMVRCMWDEILVSHEYGKDPT